MTNEPLRAGPPATKQDIIEGGRRAVAEARSQATLIEQSRAAAEVQGAVVLAQTRPRDATLAAQRALDACKQKALAERAFFRFSRAGSQISGPSIHLARELARCWGNIDYGLKELHRDDAAGQSEMLAYAWDLETNTRADVTFIVPHARDTKQGRKMIVDMRDIYENNTNMGARRLREMIFAVLPSWLMEEAKETCLATLQGQSDEPMERRRVRMIEAFAQLGVSKAQIEDKMARRADALTAADLATLQVIHRSIKRGETTAADEFERDRAGETTAALKRQALAKPARDRTAEAQGAVESVTLRDADDPGALFPEDDFNPGQFTADAMARIRRASGEALDEFLGRYTDDMEKLRLRAPKSHAAVEAAIKKRREEIA